MTSKKHDPKKFVPFNPDNWNQATRRQFLRRSVLVGATGLIGANLLDAGLNSALAQAVPKRGGTLKAAFSADPAGFDPVRGPSGMSHIVIEQVYSTLMLLTPEAEPVPGLAESHDISKDGKEYTFHLRQGVKFHNGDPLTAEDVKFTFDRLRAPNSGYSYGAQVAMIDDVVALDKYTVRFKLSERTGPFLIYMAFPGSSIVPKKLVESGHNLNAKPIGSGPFKFVSYEPRTAIKFERNPDYYEKGKPYFDGMEYRIISDPTSLTNAVMSGLVNFSKEIPPKDWARVKTNQNLTTHAEEGSSYYWLLPNNTHKHLNNAKVRQAIAYAIDRQAIVDGVFFHQATPILGGVIPKWNWAYAPQDDIFTPRSNYKKAKSLLAQAGYPNGFETTMTVTSSFPAMPAMAPIIQANLAEIGIRTKISTMEVPRYWDEVWSNSNFDITTMYWVSPLADPDDFVGNNYGCHRAINVQKYCSKKMDELLAAAVSAPTRAKRKELYAEVQKLSLDDMPIVPLVNAWVLTAHSKELTNFKPMRTGMLKTLKDAWFEA